MLFSKNDLGDGFLSDMDEEPVDMEEIREGMKLVPLPDMLPTDMDRDTFPLLDDIMGLQAPDDAYKLSDSEADGNIAGKAAAKVAAQAASPDVLTGGVAAEEVGPPPDFSLWTVEDDLLLKNAMEAGAAMEALAKGAMRFSRRYTVRELRERWRALLYDQEISSKAAARMVEAETAFLESMRRMFPSRQKLHDFVHKRRQKSVRDTFYKSKRGLHLEEKDRLADLSDLDFGDSDFFLDPDDQAFSQMVDLLASGGIGAVIGELDDFDPAERSPSSPPKAVADPPGKGLGETSMLEPTCSVLVAREKAADAPTRELRAPWLQLMPGADAPMREMRAPTTLLQAEAKVEAEVKVQLQVQAGVQTRIQPAEVQTGVQAGLQAESGVQSRVQAGLQTETGVKSRVHAVVQAGLLAESVRVQAEVQQQAGVQPEVQTGVIQPAEVKDGVKDAEENYVLLSSDEDEDEDEDEEYFREAKRPRMSSPVRENLMCCTLNTQETDIPEFETLESPSTDEEMMPASPAAPLAADHHRGDVTSDVKSSECCANYSGYQPRAELSSYDEEQQSLSLSLEVQTGETVERLVEEEPHQVPAALTETTARTETLVEEGNAEAPKADGFLDSPALPVEQNNEVDKQDVESDAEMGNFSDVETMILDMDLDPGDNDVSARAESKRFYKQHQLTIMRLEQSVGSAMQRYLTLRGAIAIFYGSQLEFFLTKNEVSLGRTTPGNVVDIDLAQEGPANKISRKQAIIKLSPNGVYYLKNLGKKVLYVNDTIVVRGQRVALSSNCLVEVSGMRFIFDINRRLTSQRAKELSRALQPAI